MSLNSAMGRDDAALLTPAFCAAEYSLTAGAGTDNVQQAGASLDLRDGFGTTRFRSLTAVLAATATLAAAATLQLKNVRFEHSDDGSTWVDYATGVTALTLTGPTGGGTVTGAAEIGCNLVEAKRYVRLRHTPDLSASGTDTAKVSPAYILSSPSVI